LAGLAKYVFCVMGPEDFWPVVYAGGFLPLLVVLLG
jgi:hypothetical protein